jgi:hypothetical protein
MGARKRIWEIILNPSGYLEEIRDQPFNDDILTFILVTVTGSVLAFIATIIRTAITGHGELPDPAGIPIMILSILFMFIVDGLFLMLVLSLIGHFFVLITGEHRGFEKTMKSVMYASVVPILFIWVPAVFRIPYSVLLLAGAFCIATFYGILIFHKKTKDRAAFVALFTTGFILILLWFNKVNLIGNIW